MIILQKIKCAAERIREGERRLRKEKKDGRNHFKNKGSDKEISQ